MAKLNPIKTIKINLPTIEGGYVEGKQSMTVADIQDITALEDKKDKLASQLKILLVDWNLEDDKGKLELSVENINKLDVKDMMAIFKELKLDNPKDFLGLGGLASGN